MEGRDSYAMEFSVEFGDSDLLVASDNNPVAAPSMSTKAKVPFYR